LPDKRQTLIERIDNFARGVANGMTLGAADYIAGVVNALFTGEGLRKSMRAELKRTQDGHDDSIAGEFVGAALGAGKIASVVRRSLELGGLRETVGRYRELRALERATREPWYAGSSGRIAELQKVLAKEGFTLTEASSANVYAIQRQTELMTEAGAPVAIGTGGGLLSIAANTVSRLFGPRALEDENNGKGATSFKPKSLLGITPK
jgi:hypothetical protein